MNEEDLERSVDLMIEQSEMIDHIHKIREELKGRGRAWNRFRGDAFARVVAHYLEKHLPDRFRIVRLAWIEGCETEFDLLVVDKDAEPLDFTGAYPKEQAHLLVEVKGSGVFYKQEEISDRLSKNFAKWKQKTGKPILYLSFWETERHLQEVLKALGGDTAFVLQYGNKGDNPTEWERFLMKMGELLRI